MASSGRPKKEPREPMLDEVGVSQRETFERCEAKWFYSQLMGTQGWGLIPTAAQIHFDWGTIGHAGLRVWYDGLRSGLSPEEAMIPAQQAIEATLAEFELPPDDNSLEITKSFMEGYSLWYAPDCRKKVRAVEWSFTIPAEIFYSPQMVEQACRQFGCLSIPAIRGTVDLICQPEDNVFEVTDHKFVGIVNRAVEEKLAYWKQPIVYSRAVKLLWSCDHVRYVHNQVRKPAKGLRPKFNKSNGTVESAADFLGRIRQEYVEFPDYNEAYPNNKVGYFHRSDAFDVDVDSQSFLWELIALDAQMSVKRDMLPESIGYMDRPWYIPRKSPGVACEAYFTKCPYQLLCSYGQTPATMPFFVERERPHP